MRRAASPALRGTVLGRLLNLWNPVMKRLLRSPLHWPWSRWFTVIEWTGRRSGRRYSTPVAYLLRGEEVWVTTGDAWWRNLGSNPLTHVWLAGRQVVGDAAVVTDRQESVELHTTMFEVRPFYARLAGLPARPAGTQIAKAVNAGRVLVRIRLRFGISTPTGDETADPTMTEARAGSASARGGLKELVHRFLVLGALALRCCLPPVSPGAPEAATRGPLATHRLTRPSF